MTLLRRRAAGRSCSVHGDNGCEIQGEAGPRTRAQDKREWRFETLDEITERVEVARKAFELGKRMHRRPA